MTSHSLSSVNPVRALLVGSLLIAAGCSTTSDAPSAAQTPPASAAVTAPARPAAEGAFDDDPRPPTAAENIVIAAGLDPAKLAAAQTELLAILQNPDSQPAAAQEAAQLLGQILLTGRPEGHATTVNALAPMLADPARSEYARLALDRVPGSAVDSLYLQALTTTSGRTRLGILDVIGTRGISAAVTTLAGLLNETDTDTAAAAASALGQIGGQTALAALAQAKDPLAPTILKARLAAAAKADAATAAQVAGEVYRNTSAPLGQRSVALRQLIAANPAGAVEEIHAALAGSESAFHAAAIESVRSLPVADAGAKLAARLGSYAPAVQSSLVAALGHRADASAVPGLIAALDGTDADIRLAALDALGRLPGNIDTARKLATLAARRGNEAQAASAALARLNGPGLDAFIRTGAATEGDNALRAVYIQQIAARNLTDAIPFLLGLRSSPVESLRLEALDALRLIAAPTDQKAVIDWAVGAAGRTEQNRAVRALITLILRDGAVETRAAPVIAALKAGDASARQVLLPVLSRATGAAALAVAGELARSTDEAVASAATGELARWPDASALPVLVDLARATQSESVRAAAVQGAARFLSSRTPAVAESRSAQTRALLELPLGVPARQALINVLSLCNDQASLDVAKKFLADADTADAARDAVDAISSNLAGLPVVTASVTSADPALMADGKNNTFWQVPANEAGTWIRADLHNARPVRKITLEHTGRGWGYPGKFDVQVSDNPDQPGDAVIQAEGDRGQTVVTLPAGTRGRYVWLRLTGRRDAPLAIGEFIVE